jgi:hypothetical protein
MGLSNLMKAKVSLKGWPVPFPCQRLCLKTGQRSSNVKKPRFVFDSFALLAYFQAEPAALKVKEILKQAQKRRPWSFSAS